MSNVNFLFQTTGVECRKARGSNLLDSLDGYIRHATLDYGLMTVMDENDLGCGPMTECQITNLHNIDDEFMDFKTGLLRMP